MSKLWNELKRRNVVRVGVAYALLAWLALQVLDFALDLIEAPNWVMQLLVVLAIVGLPAVLLFAWVFELTPEGIKRESEINRGESIAARTGQKLNFLIIAVLAVAVIVLGYREYAGRGSAPVETASQAQAPVATSIAVLPFEDYSEAGDQGHFSKGIAEEILNLLAKTNELHVAARTSSFSFAGSDEDIRSIGQKLDVGTVLEGSIRKAGPTIRITAQLINVEDGYHIWSETYDRDYEDIFRIQDEIAASIMSSLRVHLLGEQAIAQVSQRAEDMEAYSAYLIGRERMALRTKEDLEAARAQFEKSLELDPSYVPAMVQLAHTWLLLEQEQFGGRDIKASDVDEVVSPLLERAIELAPDLAEAVSVKGFHDLRRYRYEQARESFDRALKLNPNDAQTYSWRAEIAYKDKRYLDMLADKEKAYALDPMSLQISSDLAAEYRNFWRPQDAERVIERMFDLHPDHPLAYQAAAGNLFNHGRYGEGMLMLEKAMAANPGNEMFQNWHPFGLVFLGLFDAAMSVGDNEVKLFTAIAMEDFERAERLLDEGVSGDDADRYYGYGRWLYSMHDGENAMDRLARMVQLDIAKLDERGVPWQESCFLYLINELRMLDENDKTETMMAECHKVMEERFRAQYLCPCSWGNVVKYTILDGRLEEAMQRADQWLRNGDSDVIFHLDPIFNQLSREPGYDDLVARNAAQVQRQRNIYLAGTDREWGQAADGL